MLRETTGLKEDFITGMKEFINKSKENKTLIGKCAVEIYDKDGTMIQKSEAENTIKDHMFLENFYAIYDYIVHNFHHNDPNTAGTSNHLPGPIHSIRLLSRKFSKKESNKIHMNKTDYQDELIGYANTHVPITNTDSVRGTINDNETKIGYEWIDGKLYQKIEIVLDFPTNSANGTFNLVETRMHRMNMPWHSLSMSSSRVSARLGDDWYGYGDSSARRDCQYCCKSASRATVRDNKIYYLEIYPEHSSIYRRIRLAEGEMGNSDVKYKGETTDDLEVKYPMIYFGNNRNVQHCVKMSDDKKYMYVLAVHSEYYCTLTKIDWVNNVQVWGTKIKLPTRLHDHTYISECGVAFIFDEDTMDLKIVMDTITNNLSYINVKIDKLRDMGWSESTVLSNVKLRSRLGYLAEMYYYKGDKKRLLIVRRGAIGYDQHTSAYVLDIDNIQTRSDIDRPMIPILGDVVNGSLYYDEDNDIFISKRDSSAIYVQPDTHDLVFSEDEIVPITKSSVNTMKLRYIFYTPVPKAINVDEFFEYSSMTSDKKHSWTKHPQVTVAKFEVKAETNGKYLVKYNVDEDETYSDYKGLVLVVRASNDSFATYDEASIPMSDNLVSYRQGHYNINTFVRLNSIKKNLTFRVYVKDITTQTISSTYLALPGIHSYTASEASIDRDWAIKGEKLLLKSGIREGISDITVNGTSLGKVYGINTRTDLVDGQDNIIVLTYDSGRVVRYTLNLPAEEDYHLATFNNLVTPVLENTVSESSDNYELETNGYHAWSAPHVALSHNGGAYESGWHMVDKLAVAAEGKDYIKAVMVYKNKKETPITFDRVDIFCRDTGKIHEKPTRIEVYTSDDGLSWSKVIDEVFDEGKSYIHVGDTFRTNEPVTTNYIKFVFQGAYIISGINVYFEDGEYSDDFSIRYNRAYVYFVDAANSVLRTRYIQSGWRTASEIVSSKFRAVKLVVTRNQSKDTNLNGISFTEGYHHSDGRMLRLFCDRDYGLQINRYNYKNDYDYKMLYSDEIVINKEVIIE